MKTLNAGLISMAWACGTPGGPTAADSGPGQADTAAESDTDAPGDDADGDGHAAPADCDDTDPRVHPGAVEVCNGVDDDCDGQVDDADDSLSPVGKITVHVDADGDGYGAPGTATTRCDASEGFSILDTDCDDSSSNVHPGADEVCASGADEDCDGTFGEACGVLAFGPDVGLDDEGRFEALDSDTSVGRSFSIVGFDLDGDGIQDAVVGDPTASATESLDGVVHVLWGAADRASSFGVAQVALQSAVDLTSPGIQMAAFDDVTGDGRPQLAFTGALGVWWMEPLPGLRGATATTEDVARQEIAVLSATNTPLYPSGVFPAGDVDDDGLVELLVSVPSRVYVFNGQDLASGAGRLVSDEHGLLLDKVGLNGFGEARGSAGLDLNGDGYAEVAVGAAGTAGQFGRVAIYDGLDLSDGVVDGRGCVLGAEFRDGFGMRIAAAGDLNGDGYPDLAVANAHRELHLFGGGLDRRAGVLASCEEATLPSARSTDRVLELFSAGPFLDTVSISASADATGDGRADLLVVSGDDDTPGGAVEIFAGADGWEAVSASPALTLESSSDLYDAASVDLTGTGAGVPTLLVPVLSGSGVGLEVGVVDVPGF